MSNEKTLLAKGEQDGAKSLLTTRGRMPRPPSSRRKAGAETIDYLSTSRTVSPQPSPRKRKRQAKPGAIPTALLPAAPSTAAKRGRASARVLPIAKVPGQPLSGVHAGRDTQTLADTGAGGSDLARTISTIRELWPMRQNIVAAQTALNNRAMGFCRRLASLKLGHEAEKKKVTTEAQHIFKAAMGKGQHELAPAALRAIFPIIRARDSMDLERKAFEKSLASLAMLTPGAAYVEATHGFGYLGLAAIIGECGDLANYANPAKLWKRMGVAVMGDGRQRRVTDKEQAILHGFNPSRRAVLWTIGDSLIRAQAQVNGALYQVYVVRKAYATAQHPDWTKKHCHLDAKRYMEKRLLLELWRAWRGQAAADTQLHPASPNS